VIEFFNVEPYDEYEQAFRRLRDGEHLRGITARLNGKMVGLFKGFITYTRPLNAERSSARS